MCMQTFRLYRAAVDEQKSLLKAQYTKLLEDCVRDAVYLSDRNQELLDDNEKLKAGW